MRPIKIVTQEIVDRIRRYKVIKIKQLIEELNCSAWTLFNKLKVCGYHTSYNFNGQYITLKEIPVFDENGIWKYRQARFSKWTNVEESISHIVNKSPKGLTPNEITEILQIRTHNQLLKCRKKGLVVSRRYGRNQVYFSADKSISKLQIEKRKKYLQNNIKGATSAIIPQESKSFDLDKVHFGFLAQLILGDALTAEDIYQVLDGMGKSFEQKDIKELIIRHNIDLKKTQFQLVFLTERRKDVRPATED